jgi:hypothetical protein
MRSPRRGGTRRRTGVEVDARLADALTAALPACDLVLANIARPTVEALATRLRCRVLVASGYLETEPLHLPGFRHRQRRTAEGWAADVYERADLLAQSRHSGVT